MLPTDVLPDPLAVAILLPPTTTCPEVALHTPSDTSVDAQGKCQTDMPPGQSDGRISLIEVPSSQMTLICVKLATLTGTGAEDQSTSPPLEK